MIPVKFSVLHDAAKQCNSYIETVGEILDNSFVYPEQIRYNKDGVSINNLLFKSDYPKLMFCTVLSCYSEPSVFQSIEYQGKDIQIGGNCTIGGSGFGYVTYKNIHTRMPHLGKVVIHDEVIIHNNVNIDRGVIGNTVIGSGSRIDSLVHIAHNVQIGRNVLIVAGSIIGGSVVIGDNSFIGMGAKIKNKVTIGKNCIIGAGAVVLKDVPDGETWAGCPAKAINKTEVP